MAQELGLVSIGTAPISKYSGFPSGHHPCDYLPETITVITFAYPLNTTSILNLPKTRNQYTEEYDTVNQLLFQAAHQIARLLEKKGFSSLPIKPTAGVGDLTRLKSDFSHKHSAVQCGLGQFGLNNLLITPEHGPAVRLSSVLTTADISMDNSIGSNLCDSCERCLKVCPSGALNLYKDKFTPQTGRPMDKEKCSYYMQETLGGQSCGMCLKVCLRMSYKDDNTPRHLKPEV